MAEQQQISPTYILRGPMIAAGALVSFAIPYVIELSPRTLWHLSIIVGAMLWFCWDLQKWVERTLRISLDRLLNSLVLDDILRMIYDPEDGVLACMVGGFFGATTMYGLKLQEEDKTRLVQATLEIDYQQANSLLMTPGGCKAWLPQGMQQWLNQHHQHTPSQSSNKIKAIEDYGTEHYSNVGERDERGEEEEEASLNHSRPTSPLASEPLLKKPLNGGESKMNIDANGNGNDDAKARKQGMPVDTSTPQRLCRNPTDPVDEMVSILRRLAYSQAKQYLQSIPESLLETVGLSAVAMLGTHLHFNRRNNRRGSSTLGVATGLLLAGVASGAISTIVAKRMMLKKGSFSTVCREMMTRSWQTIKDQALRKEQWRSYLAMIVLLVLGRRQIRR
ncbi:unnamed protein product [Cylindrotheca closterium]|uniref:Uncharacterized protein n=1 Tax=Cylindrotheca closterium TaxID=2856 RepID=A0AAD2GC18_9STRA|nr:unnamed protein product [Cylindrotheca closterium]